MIVMIVTYDIYFKQIMCEYSCQNVPMNFYNPTPDSKLIEMFALYFRFAIPVGNICINVFLFLFFLPSCMCQMTQISDVSELPRGNWAVCVETCVHIQLHW